MIAIKQEFKNKIGVDEYVFCYKCEINPCECSNKELVREYIQKEIPEIMDLAFGCEVIADLTGYVQTTDNVKVVDKVMSLTDNLNIKNSIKVYREFNGDIIDNLPYNRYKDKILGRPITLVEVLRVIEEKMTIDERGKRLQDKMHSLIDFYLCPDGGVADPLWNLKENYDKQSDEVYDLLANILLENIIQK